MSCCCAGFGMYCYHNSPHVSDVLDRFGELLGTKLLTVRDLEDQFFLLIDQANGCIDTKDSLIETEDYCRATEYHCRAIEAQLNYLQEETKLEIEAQSHYLQEEMDLLWEYLTSLNTRADTNNTGTQTGAGVCDYPTTNSQLGILIDSIEEVFDELGSTDTKGASVVNANVPENAWDDNLMPLPTESLDGPSNLYLSVPSPKRNNVHLKDQGLNY
jgi:hypothetical protein